MNIGGKAKNLTLLKKAGFNVPKFEVIPYSRLQHIKAEELKKLINKIHQKIKAQSYAVRSSANVEDSSDLSYAGLFETYINILPENLFQKVLDVFNKINNTKLYKSSIPIQMSVIIQEYITPNYSGVCFTELGNQIVINLHNGIGEDLVSGKVKGEEIRIDKEIFCFCRKPIILLNYSNLIREFLKIESLYKTPQDIEFCIKSDELFILQSRSITTK